MKKLWSNNDMLSIIIPTVGRKVELEVLLNSIEKADIEIPYEIIIVDQNPKGFLDEICEQYAKKLPLVQYNVSFKGASKARNYGVQKAIGDIACFPDDDAEFLPDTIEKALGIMSIHEVECLFGKAISKETGEDVIIRFQKEAKFLSLTDFEGAFVEFTMFAKTSLLREFPYDEELGVGTIHGAEEAYDLVYRLLREQKKIYYSPEIKFYHPQKIIARQSISEIKRAFYYSCGLGYLCRKHKFKKKYWKRMLKLSLGIPVVAIVKRSELRYYQAQKMGLKLGYKFI